jgi:SNF2 family DNA or RNA helicase
VQPKLDEYLTRRALQFLPLFSGVEEHHIRLMDLDGSMSDVSRFVAFLPGRARSLTAVTHQLALPLRPIYLKLVEDQCRLPESERIAPEQISVLTVASGGNFEEAIRLLNANRRNVPSIPNAGLPLSSPPQSFPMNTTLAQVMQYRNVPTAHVLSQHPAQHLYPESAAQSIFGQAQAPPSDSNLNPTGDNLPIGDFVVPVRASNVVSILPGTPLHAQVVTSSLEIRFVHGNVTIGVMSNHHSRRLAPLLMRRTVSMTSALDSVDPQQRSSFTVRCSLMLEKRFMATGTAENHEAAMQHKQTADDREPPMMFILNRLTPRCACCAHRPLIDPRSELLSDVVGSRVSFGMTSSTASLPRALAASSNGAAANASTSVAPVDVDGGDAEARSTRLSFLSAPVKQLERLAPPPGTMKVSIYPYQEQALWWMTQCETQQHEASHPLFAYKHAVDGTPYYVHKFRPIVWAVEPPKTDASFGGILADDMGVGKTIETLSLIASRPRPAAETDGDAVRATLVILPVSLLDQWAHELKRFTHLTYHTVRTKKEMATLPQRAAKVDVVFTTYNAIAGDYKENSERGVFYGMQWWRIVLDEAHLIRSRMTLKAKSIFDLRAVQRWCLTGTPIQNKIEDVYALLRFLRVHPLDDFAWFNYLIGKPLSAGPDSVVGERAEAAMTELRNAVHPRLLRRLKSEVLGSAALAASSLRKPIVDDDDDDEDDDGGGGDGNNGVHENGHSFGVARPRGDDDDDFDGNADDDDEEFGSTKPVLKRRALSNGGNGDEPMSSDMSRRADFKGRTVHIVRLRLSPGEANLYNWMAQRVSARVQLLSDQGALGRNISNVLEMLLRLRQCCSHPFLVVNSLQTKLKKMIAKGKSEAEVNDVRNEVTQVQNLLKGTAHAAWLGEPSATAAASAVAQTGDDLLARAQEAMASVEAALNAQVDLTGIGDDDEDDLQLALRASLEFRPQSSSAAMSWMQTNSEVDESASLLSAGHLSRLVPESAVSSSFLDYASGGGGGGGGGDDDDDGSGAGSTMLWSALDRHFVSSTKITHLVQRLLELRSTTREKSIVFCQFTSMMDLIAVALKRERIGFERFDGSMTTAARTKALNHFREDDKCAVLMCSLKAGNLGLNLDCASRVFLFAPWFNPYVEEQAIARVDRLGQRREVVVERLIIEGTVEENLLKMQARKTQMVERAGLKADDIKSLLDIKG